MVKNIKTEKAIDAFQYVLSIGISIAFGIGIIPFMYYLVFPVLIVLLLLQLIISVIRLRFVNIVLEFILLLLSILSLIPILGFVFRVAGTIVGIIDTATFKSLVIYQRIDVMSREKAGIKRGGISSKKKKNRESARDAEFEEK